MHPLYRLATLVLAGVAAFTVPAASATVSPSRPPSSAAPRGSAVPTFTARITRRYKTFVAPAAVDYDHIDQFTVEFGTLKLVLNPDRTVRGTYRPDFGSATTVTGTANSDGTLILQIGDRRFTGKFTPRGIAATTSAPTRSGWNLWAQTESSPTSTR